MFTLVTTKSTNVLFRCSREEGVAFVTLGGGYFSLVNVAAFHFTKTGVIILPFLQMTCLHELSRSHSLTHPLSPEYLSFPLRHIAK